MSDGRAIWLGLFLIVVLALIVFAVSFFIQPSITIEANTILLLAVAAILGVASFLASLNEISQLLDRLMAVVKNWKKSRRPKRLDDASVKLAKQHIQGREREKELIRRFLEQSSDASNIVCIYGFAGLGKTTLLGYASIIAQELNIRVVGSASLGTYETVAPFESFPLFIKRLWSKPEETGELSDYEIIEQFIIRDTRGHIVLLIDEFKSDDARFCSDFEWFYSNAKAKGKHVTVITASRAKPALRSSLGPVYIHLDELDLPSVQRMIAQRWPYIASELDITRLFMTTGGNPQLIEYVCSNVSVWTDFVDGKAIEFDVLKEVWKYVVSTSSEVEQALCILSVVARFSKEFDSAIAQSLIREWHSVRHELIDRSLITEKRKGIYRIHDLLSTYIYTQINSPRDIHKAVGLYYLDLKDDNSWFLGFVHLACAQDIPSAKPIYYKYRERIRYFGFAPEVEAALSSLLASIDAKEPAFKANLLEDLGLFLLHKHRYDEAMGEFDQALDLYRTSGNNSGLAWTLLSIGTVYRMMSRYDTALSYSKQAEQIFVRTNDILGQSWTSREQAEIYYAFGQSKEAEAMYSMALDLSGRLGDKRGQAGALRGLANIFARQMRFSDALSKFEDASRLAQEIKDKQGQAYAIEGIGTCLRCQRKYSDVETHYQSALNILREIDDPAGLQVTELQMAVFLRVTGRLKEAKELYESCTHAATELRRPGDLVRIHRGLAEIARMEGDLERALDLYNKSRLQSEELGLTVGIAHSILGLSETNRLKGDISLETYAEALTIYRRTKIPWGIIHTLIGKGLACLATGHTGDAGRLFLAADTYCRLLGLATEREFIATATGSEMHVLDF